jgi:FdhD protein
MSRDPEGSESWPTAIVIDGRRQELPDPVAVEEPLEIRIGPTPLAVAMRTPGHDAELAAGFLHAEGLVQTRSDLLALRAAPECGVENVVEVRLRDEPAAARAGRAFVATSSCGVCGKTSIEQVFATGLPLPERGRPRIPRRLLEELPERMRRAQRLFSRTGGLHAAALFEPQADGLALRVLREDVGRHNAVDKVVGERLLAGRLPLRDALLVLSGRASFEVVQKAARAGIPLVAAVGAPSSLALRLAERTGMTLVGFLRRGRFNLYTASERIEDD